MSLISVTTPNNGETADANVVATAFDTIVDDYNGNVDVNNLADNSITTAKMVDANVTSAKLATNAATGNDGWVSTPDTWTYVSVSTFTVPGDKTATYTAGTRLKWTQTTVKYGVVVSSAYGAPNTTVTIAVNTNYTIASAAITLNYYSYCANPQGYTGWFNFVPTLANLAGGTLNYYKYQIVDHTVNLRLKYTLAGAGVSGIPAFTVPATISSAMISNTEIPTFSVIFTDISVGGFPGWLSWESSTTFRLIALNTAGTYMVTAGTSSTVPFTWASGDVISVSLSYEMN